MNDGLLTNQMLLASRLFHYLKIELMGILFLERHISNAVGMLYKNLKR